MTYLDSKIVLERNFEIAAKFIDSLESQERIQKGFNIGTSINLHFYLNNWFLFRMEFVGFDAIKIDLRRRNVPNKQIKSVEFFLVVKEMVMNSSGKNHQDFYKETLIINKSNSGYFDILNQSIDRYYNQVAESVETNNTHIIQDIKEIPEEKFVLNRTDTFYDGLEKKRLSIRNASGVNISYFQINREERNLCAILFHTLLLGDNLSKFLKKINCNFPIIDSEKAIYLEYAFIRDIWENIRKENGVTEGNKIKRKIILEILNLAKHSKLETMSIFEFNNLFVQSNTRAPSSVEIESPGNWSIIKFNENFSDNDEFLNICKFKWSFNAKPDIVIHTSNNQAICIEGKFKSGEGIYPANKVEKEIFKKRNLGFVGQLSIQQMIMNLLDIEAKFVLLANSSISSATHKSYTWKEIFDELETANCPNFIAKWLTRSDIN